MLSNNPCSIITRGFYTFYPLYQGQKRLFSLNNRIFSIKNWKIVVLKKILIFLNHNRRSQLFLRSEFLLFLAFLERNSWGILMTSPMMTNVNFSFQHRQTTVEFFRNSDRKNSRIFSQDKQIWKKHGEIQILYLGQNLSHFHALINVGFLWAAYKPISHWIRLRFLWFG